MWRKEICFVADGEENLVQNKIKLVWSFNEVALIVDGFCVLKLPRKEMERILRGLLDAMVYGDAIKRTDS